METERERENQGTTVSLPLCLYVCLSVRQSLIQPERSLFYEVLSGLKLKVERERGHKCAGIECVEMFAYLLKLWQNTDKTQGKV